MHSGVLLSLQRTLLPRPSGNPSQHVCSFSILSNSSITGESLYIFSQILCSQELACKCSLKLHKGITSEKRTISFQNHSHLPVVSVTSCRMMGLFSWMIVKQVVIMMEIFFFLFPVLKVGNSKEFFTKRQIFGIKSLDKLGFFL